MGGRPTFIDSSVSSVCWRFSSVFLQFPSGFFSFSMLFMILYKHYRKHWQTIENWRKLQKNWRIDFSQKLFCLQFRLTFGRSGGVRENGMDHTKTLSRTLARFGLPWHGKVHFSTFYGKLECSSMTKYLQICFWIFPKARGFCLNVLRRKSILKNDPHLLFSRN